MRQNWTTRDPSASISSVDVHELPGRLAASSRPSAADSRSQVATLGG
eukprot:CAMPEP_0181182366 /NCGR_PEP_ID=MMETSP1096-20121128/7852_1 /TAXON_ID=156174 ORGANISM="Chrysochromulina ericina, Strain CCMP281" /NCGR_SAMPLE_ID=MMETSP1096 /ASSEMBLY_ACC=CAM_ASM_000453 /LENGTH=46 /DNA_ID= /DNA_START= /DNA_END= /DNA_ORIENTATION=